MCTRHQRVRQKRKLAVRSNQDNLTPAHREHSLLWIVSTLHGDTRAKFTRHQSERAPAADARRM